MNIQRDPFASLKPETNGDAYDWQPSPPNEAYAAEFTGHKTAPAPSFRFVAIGDLEYRPPEFLINGMIETDSLGLLFGDPGCGKSFAAADLALCVATGLPFHGKPVKQGVVFYIAGEGHNGLVRRFTAWSKYQGVSLKGVPMFKSERAAQFLDAASARAVSEAVDALAATYGQPTLIVIDTLARNFGGGDENSTQEMNQFVAAMDDLRERWAGCVVLIVHHSGHGDKGRARGAMALKGALDFEYRLEKEDTHLTLTNTKMKDAEPPPEMSLMLETVEIETGVKSAVLIEAEPIVKAPKISGQAKIALQAFGDALGHHGAVKHGDMFPLNRQCVSVEIWREFCDRHSLSSGDSESAARNAFNRARTTLQDKGVICVVDGYAWRTE